jgi:hypothetical protein
MNTACDNGVDAARTPQEREPSLYQLLCNCERTRSPSLKDRVIIYDSEKQSLEVRSKKEVDKGKPKKTRSHHADNSL